MRTGSILGSQEAQHQHDDQTVAGDYFTSMSRVEQRMEIEPLPKQTSEAKDEVVKEQEYSQIVTWLELLALPELCQEDRLELVDRLKRTLNLNLVGDQAPLLRIATAA